MKEDGCRSSDRNVTVRAQGCREVGRPKGTASNDPSAAANSILRWAPSRLT